MRGEIFDDNEIYESVERKLNPNLSADVYELQEQYEILLEYVETLEERNEKRKKEIARLQRLINKYERT